MHGVNINLDPSCGNCGNCFTLDNWIADQEKRARAFRMSFDFEELETGSISCGGQEGSEEVGYVECPVDIIPPTHKISLTHDEEYKERIIIPKLPYLQRIWPVDIHQP
jgi:hypothetical protein